MLRLSFKVTKTRTNLEQISEVVIINRGGPFQQKHVLYDVYFDGEPWAQVHHDRYVGALVLAHKALGELIRVGVQTGEQE